MSHTITGKLNKPARQHQAGENMIFFVDIGEKNYDRKAGQNTWTNYSAAIFAKGNQVGFYQQALVEGAIVSVSGTGLIVEMPDNPQYQPRLQLQDAKLVFVSAPQQPQQAQPQQSMTQQPQGGSQQHKQAPMQQAQGFDQYDDSIPF